jgi:glycosyltransferase involved in cell wall biosynthesis
VIDHGETGYLVPPADARALADAVATLLENHDLRLEMGRQALEKARSDLSWPKIASQTWQVYRRAIATSRRGRKLPWSGKRYDRKGDPT